MAKQWDVIDNHLLSRVIKEWAARPGQTLGEPTPKNPTALSLPVWKMGVNIHLALHICSFYFVDSANRNSTHSCRGLIVLQRFI